MLPFGGGTKVKVIEAMAHGVPIVANSVAAEGLALVDGQNALIRDTAPRRSPLAAWSLLHDPSVAERIGLAGLDTWSEQHRPESVEASIKALIETLRQAEPGESRGPIARSPSIIFALSGAALPGRRRGDPFGCIGF